MDKNNEIEISVEMLEALVARVEASDEAERGKLDRMIRAYARILAVREPEKFRAMPLEYGDVAGHWDTSFPPRMEYREHCGPRLIVVRDCDTRDLPTSTGFYHNWRRVTESPGLFVDRDGEIWGCEESGTGRLGQFAAHPGDCGVEVEVSYDRRDDVSLAELREVEHRLRALAFPREREAQEIVDNGPM